MNRELSYGIAATFIIFLAAFFFNDSVKYKESTNGPDVWEYQTVAVNLAQYNRFPVMGYLGREGQYQINTLQSNTVNDYLKCRFTTNGSVTYLAKPPLYVFTLGMVYKIFQPEIKYAYYLNLFFFAGILLLLMFSGHTLDNSWGFLMGNASALVYAFFGTHKLSDVLPATFTTFLLCAFALTTLLIVKSFSLKRFAVLGIITATTMLTKGDIIFLAFITPLFLYINFYKNHGVYKATLIMITSCVLLLTPWLIFSNALRLSNKTELAQWKENIIKTENDCLLDTTKRQDWENRGSIILNNEYGKLATHYFSRYAKADKFIIISNQVTSDEFLSVHNELNTDGHWHPEWRVRSENTYNQKYLDKPVPLKILSFYLDNPVLLYEIALAKLLRATASKFSFFLLAAFLFGSLLWFKKIIYKKTIVKIVFLLLVFSSALALGYFNYKLYVLYATLFFFSSLLIYRQSEMKFVPFIFPACIINSFLILFVFYGDPRFTYVIEPLTIFSTLYFLHLFFQKNDFPLAVEDKK